MNFQIEKCSFHYFGGRPFTPQKIRRSGQEDVFFSKNQTLQSLLPNTILFFIDNQPYYLEFVSDGKSIFLQNIYNNKKRKKISYQLKANEIISCSLTRVFDKTTGIVFMPVYPWGSIFDYSFLFINHEGLDNSLKSHSSTNLNLPIKLISYKLNKTKKTVFLGRSHTLTLLSVPWPHYHVSQPSADPNTDEIVNYRNTVNWDNGISYLIAQEVINNLQNCSSLHNCKNNINFQIDKTGITFDLNEMKPEKIVEPYFLTFFDQLELSIDTVLRQLHFDMHSVEIDKLFSYITFLREKGLPLSQTECDHFFMLKKGKSSNCKHFSPKISQLYEQLYMDNLLRKPPAWGSLFRFEPNGKAQLYIMFSFIKEPIGPFESIGIKLEEDKTIPLKSINEQFRVELLDSLSQ